MKCWDSEFIDHWLESLKCWNIRLLNCHQNGVMGWKIGYSEHERNKGHLGENQHEKLSWKVLGINNYNLSKSPLFIWFSCNILYIKATVVSVCLFVVTNRAGQGSRCRGAGEVPFLLKKSLGKTGVLHLIKQKYKFKKKLFSLWNILKN